VEDKDGLSFKPHKLHIGGNSGYQAINLAVLKGAARILLLGYDMKEGPNGEKHWHSDHVGMANGPGDFSGWLKHFRTLPPDLARAGCEVLNCTPDSALDCFPRARLEDVV
jgi:hypothetical protein